MVMELPLRVFSFSITAGIMTGDDDRVDIDIGCLVVLDVVVVLVETEIGVKAFVVVELANSASAIAKSKIQRERMDIMDVKDVE
mmetsp:Transcript_15048/g.19792  ORF Transcript_15048/g.19792 Transcript_15048/m.19792 type:complete len:84 (-) Transcript_15048:189-440(-)